MIPDIVKQAILHDGYKKKPGYSATTLISPPQIKALLDRYGPDEKTIHDMLYSKLGTAMHEYLENFIKEAKPEVLATCINGVWTEEVLSKEVDGIMVNGTRDLRIDDVQYDYKVTSVWKYILGDFEEFDAQANIYQYLGNDITESYNILFFRDWSAGNAKKGNGYPKHNIVTRKNKLWSRDRQEQYIKERIALHESAKDLPDNKLPHCTEKDRWAKPTKYAVMKAGRKSAVRVLDDLQAAESLATTTKGNCHVEIRPGKNTRCDDYCPVASKCQQRWSL